MKKYVALLFAILISGVFAQVITVQYETQKGINIERTMEIEIVREIDPVMDFELLDNEYTNISIRLINDAFPKKNIEIKERVDYIPKHIDYLVNANAEIKEERVKWEFENLEANEIKTVNIYFKGTVENFENLHTPYVDAEYKNISLIVPTIGRVGDEMLITALTEDNEALSKIEITVILPSGKQEYIFTDNRGVARLTPQEEGIYSFEIPKFGNVYNIEVEKLIGQELTTAHISDDRFEAEQLIPFIVGLIALALVIFGMVLYIAPKREPGPSPEDFAQAFSPSNEDKEPEWMKDLKFSETTIGKTTIKPEEIEKTTEKTIQKESVKSENIEKEPKDRIEKIKYRSKKIAENRKKIAENKVEMVEQAIKKPVKKTNKKSAKKTSKKPVKKTNKKSVKKTTKKPIKKKPIKRK